MASTYSTNLALELIGTGDQAGTWGVTTNTNLGTLLEQAISGYVTQAVSTGTDTTITIPNGSTGVARNMYIELTGTGGTNTNLIVPANKKLYFIFNNASGAVTVKVSGQTGVSVPTGKKMILVSNGTDIVNGVNYIADFGTNSFTVTNLTATSATITNLIATTATVSDLSATVLRAASASITNLALTSLTISSLSITNVSVASATVSSNLTLSGGTANGVLYLNGSKVATSGSALTFDGSYFTVASGTGTFLADIVQVSGTATKVNANGVGLEFRGGSNPNITSYSRVGSAYLPMTLDTSASIFSISGTEAMRITSTSLYTASGINVGIGTSSPTIGLSVEKDNGSGYIAAFRANNTSPYLTIQTTSGITQLQGINSAFSATNNIAMQISGGNVGIGTSSPGGKLDVKQTTDTSLGGIYVRATDNNATVISRLTTGNLVVRNGGIDSLFLDSSGNLGIGASSPTTPLDVTKAGGGNFVANFQNTTSATPYGVSIKDAATPTAGYPLLQISNSAGSSVYFRVDSSTGNVGIGTSSPSSYSANARVLHIDGGANQAELKLTNNTSGASGVTGGLLQMAGNDFYIWNVENSFLSLGTNNTERARITSGGDLVVNSSVNAATLNNNAKLSVWNTSGSSDAKGLATGYGTTNGQFRLIYLNSAADALNFDNGNNNATLTSGGTWTNASDARLKKSILDIKYGLDAVVKSKPRSFERVDVDGEYIGFIAQELLDVVPEVVYGSEEQKYSVDYGSLVAVAFKAIQEQQAMINDLKAKVAALESK
jgi:hypothetical protein